MKKLPLNMETTCSKQQLTIVIIFWTTYTYTSDTNVYLVGFHIQYSSPQSIGPAPWSRGFSISNFHLVLMFQVNTSMNHFFLKSFFYNVTGSFAVGSHSHSHFLVQLQSSLKITTKLNVTSTFKTLYKMVGKRKVDIFRQN